jgi:hypothetical protein
LRCRSRRADDYSRRPIGSSATVRTFQTRSNRSKGASSTSPVSVCEFSCVIGTPAELLRGLPSSLPQVEPSFFDLAVNAVGELRYLAFSQQSCHQGPFDNQKLNGQICGVHFRASLRRIKGLWKNLKDCINSEKTDRIAGRPSTLFNR